METIMSDQQIPISKFQCVTPILSVKNVPKSIDHYVNILGFQKDWEWDEPPTFASVSRNDVSIFLCEDGQGQPGMWMSIFVDDVDQIFEEYKKSGANIRQEPTNFPWGVREMNIEDIDGHRLRIGSDTDQDSDGISLCED